MVSDPQGEAARQTPARSSLTSSTHGEIFSTLNPNAPPRLHGVLWGSPARQTSARSALTSNTNGQNLNTRNAPPVRAESSGERSQADLCSQCPETKSEGQIVNGLTLNGSPSVQTVGGSGQTDPRFQLLDVKC